MSSSLVSKWRTRLGALMSRLRRKYALRKEREPKSDPPPTVGEALRAHAGGLGAELLRGSQPSEAAPLVVEDRRKGEGGVPAVVAVDDLLIDAFEARASDVHIEDHADGLRVRYRIDGILKDVEPPPSELRAAVLARLRVIAGLNLAERRRPQDGRMRIRFKDRHVDVRISTVPILHGESVVLRVLDPMERAELDELGLHLGDLTRLTEVISRPHGMVLTTGPGGSGKSTTLHAIVQRLSTGEEKILTIEDPVEYDVHGVCQVSVNEQAGLTFATLLRSLVRQDPDVLLVGEIRDDETADIATHAALTGHLVLSTLHTTDSVSALPRLVDLGVPDYLVVHTLEAVMAQRLVRVVCTSCAEEADFRDEEIKALGKGAEGLSRGLQGVGCGECHGIGYRDRTGLYELLVINEELRDAFMERQSRRELRGIALQHGMRTLRDDGLVKIRAGVTTPAEVLRVT